MNQRSIALDILTKTIADESYANLLMRSELNKIPVINRALVSELVYGVLRNYDLLIYQVKDDINNRTKQRTKLIICLALYERFFLNEKDYVINNEYTELGSSKFEKGFINALLHKTTVLKKASEEDISGIAINNSLPEWIARLIASQYSEEEFKNILNVYKSKAKTYYRINFLKGSYRDLKNYPIEMINERMFTCAKPLINTKLFKQGLFYIQDINSAELIDNLELKQNSKLLDICAAPGTKLFNCLEKMNPSNAFANDIYEHRVELIKKTALKLGYSNVNYTCEDGRNLNKVFDFKFDRILLDAPCSGLGVISRKPDIKFHVTPNSLDELQKLQSELLDVAFELLENNGILLYSTCTINKKENNKQIENFLNKYKTMKLLKEETIIKEGGDCFYYAKLIKE